MGGECGTHGGYVLRILCRSLKVVICKIQRVDGRVILKCNLKQMGWKGMDWIHLSYDRYVRSCEHGTEPSGSVRYVEFLD